MESTSAKAGAVVGGVAAGLAPWWISLLQDVNIVASACASVFGAVIAAYGVFRIIRKHVPRRPSAPKGA